MARLYTPMKTIPFAHQLAEYNLSRDLPGRALWWEMGTGKTKVVLDTAAHLWETGKIGGLLIVAPDVVHQNWIADEVPAHLDIPHRTFLWETRRKGTKRFKEEMQTFMVPGDGLGLAILAMTYDAMMTADGAKAARKFLESRACLYVVDEATRIKTPGAKTTMRILASSKYAPYRRVLNGTPVADSPFQAYTQVKFADPDAWKGMGIHGAEQFRAQFGEWTKGHGQGREFPVLVKYRNLDQLHGIMDQVGSRVMKTDVLDLPPKLYSKRHYDLSPQQRAMYDQMKEEYQAWFTGGDGVTAELAIVRMTRLQQICSGWLPADEEDHLRPIDGAHPRIRCLMDTLVDVTGQAIIWGKYNVDIDSIAAALEKADISHVKLDGRTPPENRQRAKEVFQAGDARIFLGKPAAAGRGLTLHAATTVCYYNNGFSLDLRQQSEDRAHRIGQTKAVTYLDIIARDTIDEYILEVLQRKRVVAAAVTGDALPEWVQ